MAEVVSKIYRLKKGFTHSAIIKGELVELVGDGTDNVTAELNESQLAAFGDKFENLSSDVAPEDAVTTRDDKREADEAEKAEKASPEKPADVPAAPASTTPAKPAAK